MTPDSLIEPADQPSEVVEVFLCPVLEHLGQPTVALPAALVEYPPALGRRCEEKARRSSLPGTSRSAKPHRSGYRERAKSQDKGLQANT